MKLDAAFISSTDPSRKGQAIQPQFTMSMELPVEKRARNRCAACACARDVVRRLVRARSRSRQQHTLFDPNTDPAP